MPVSADTTQIGIVEESVYGVTPANPVFEILPITGESLVTAATTELSQTLNPNRQVVDSILTGLDINGALDFEFAKSPAMTMLLESAMGKDVAVNGTDEEFIVGVDQISYTIEKRWPDPVNAGQYLYHRYTGCVVNTMTLSLSAGASVTGNAAVIGKSPVTDVAMIPGATYNQVVNFNVFRGPDVKDIILDNEAGTLAPFVTGSCVTDITININNNYRGIQCLGTLGNKETVIGTFECTYDQTIFFNNNEIMDSFISQDYINEIMTIGEALSDEHYTFTTTKGKFATDEVVAGGTGTDVVNSCTVNWLLDNSLGEPTTLKISTTNGIVNPTPVSAEVGTVDASSLVITFADDIAVTDGTGFDVLVNGVTANVVLGASALGSDLTLTLTDAISNGDIVNYSYDQALGNVTDVTTSGAMLSETNNFVTNNV